MSKRILETLCWLTGIGIGAGALAVVVGLVYSLILLLPGKTTVNDGVQGDLTGSASDKPAAVASIDRTRTIVGGGDRSAAAKLPTAVARKSSKGDDSRLAKELDREFRQFLADRGQSVDELERAEAAFSAREPEPEPEPRIDPATELPREATRRLKEEYPVQDARRKANGEVWLRLDPAEAQGLSMDELSAKAAELFGDGIDPLKVVVWVGNRPWAVNTFNGHPIF